MKISTFRSGLICVALILVIGCQHNRSRETKDNNSERTNTVFEVQEDEHIVLNLDSVTSLHTGFVDLITIEGESHIAFTNITDNSIRIFDLESLREQESIIIPTEGVGGISEITGFSYVNEDSIFVFGQFGDGLILVNLRGDLRAEYNIKSIDEEKLYGYGRRFIHTTRKPIFLDGKILLSGFPMYNLSDLYALYSKSNLEIEIDLDREQYKYLNVKYSGMYNNVNYFSLNSNMTRTYNPQLKKLLMNYSSDFNIWEMDGHSEPVSHAAKSKYIDNVELLKVTSDRSANIEAYNRYLIERPFYFGLTYDKYHDLYYRFVYHGVTYVNNEGGVNNYMDGDYSIIVLDADFQVLDEVFVERNQYNFNIYFTSEEGLYLSTSNTNNPNLDEDRMVFHNIKFKNGM